MQKIVLAHSIPVCDFTEKPHSHTSLDPGVYLVKRIANPGGLGVDWFVLTGRPTMGAAIPVWNGMFESKGGA